MKNKDHNARAGILGIYRRSEDDNILSEGLRIRQDEFQILFNTLEDNLVFSYPSYNFHLISALVSDEGYSLNLLHTHRDFDKFSDLNGAGGEMPRYGDLTDCLLNAGVIQRELRNLLRTQVRTIEY